MSYHWRTSKPLQKSQLPDHTNLPNPTLNTASPYLSSSQRHKDITNAIACQMAEEMASITTFENKGLKAIIKTLDKCYLLLSRYCFSAVALLVLYTKCHRTVEVELQDMENFAATADVWSSWTMKPFLSVTVHFIANNFKMKSRFLQRSFLLWITLERNRLRDFRRVSSLGVWLRKKWFASL